MSSKEYVPRLSEKNLKIPVQPNFEVIGIAAGAGVAVLIVIAVVCYIFVSQQRCRKQGENNYSNFNTYCIIASLKLHDRFQI